MAHPFGERLRCDECGAEIVYVVACPCPEHEDETHADICCGKKMRSLGIQLTGEPGEAVAQPGH